MAMSDEDQTRLLRYLEQIPAGYFDEKPNLRTIPTPDEAQSLADQQNYVNEANQAYLVNTADGDRKITQYQIFATAGYGVGDGIGQKIDWLCDISQIPSDFIPLDGRIVNVVDYPQLWERIQGVDGFVLISSSQIQVPDFRDGYFACYDIASRNVGEKQIDTGRAFTFRIFQKLYQNWTGSFQISTSSTATNGTAVVFKTVAGIFSRIRENVFAYVSNPNGMIPLDVYNGISLNMTFDQNVDQTINSSTVWDQHSGSVFKPKSYKIIATVKGR